MEEIGLLIKDAARYQVTWRLFTKRPDHYMKWKDLEERQRIRWNDGINILSGRVDWRYRDDVQKKARPLNKGE